MPGSIIAIYGNKLQSFSALLVYDQGSHQIGSALTEVLRHCQYHIDQQFLPPAAIQTFQLLRPDLYAIAGKKGKGIGYYQAEFGIKGRMQIIKGSSFTHSYQEEAFLPLKSRNARREHNYILFLKFQLPKQSADYLHVLLPFRDTRGRFCCVIG